jgi:hypothetical protein
MAQVSNVQGMGAGGPAFQPGRMCARSPSGPPRQAERPERDSRIHLDCTGFNAEKRILSTPEAETPGIFREIAPQDALPTPSVNKCRMTNVESMTKLE